MAKLTLKTPPKAPELIPKITPEITQDILAEIQQRNQKYFAQFHGQIIISHMVQLNLALANGCVVNQLTLTCDLITGDNVAGKIIGRREAYLAAAISWASR